MTYSILTSPYDNSIVGIKLDNSVIPLNSKNRDYQEVLDSIIEHGADSFEGDIPTELQTAADEKLFNQQVEAYKTAIARLERYQLSVGVPESTEIVVTGQEWNDEIMGMQDVTETVTIPAIEPLDATVEVTTQDKIGGSPVTTTIPNPLIVQDDAERDAAQLIIDNTPQSVKDQVDGV